MKSHDAHSGSDELVIDGKTVESHPFGPVLPSNATIMMMGTFPPTEDKWGMPFHYPNFYNDMWRIYGRVFLEMQITLEMEKKKGLIHERLRIL
ncbi:uracil-DNA glycosylase family protein [Psychrobacter phenylpyruvicus]|uniref:G:T/U mismatch-specific DNA glycosylase n=1 Tax=Psychrobacter phenylpyruvicus TaxID=29432 RepID=A0A379LPN7_9GAMM|nr:G:T/U mismatch-specific DNA glycosylase [Psychrobacter phenylpyruvicus]